MSADERAYLSGFGILTHKGFVGTGEFRRELVDVQHVDRHGHPAGQNRTVWIRKETKTERIDDTFEDCSDSLTPLTSCGYSKVLLFYDEPVYHRCRRTPDRLQGM